MDDFKIIKVEIDPDTDAVRIKVLKDNISVEIKSHIHMSMFSNKYYIPLTYYRDYRLIDFISEKLNSFALEFGIPFSSGTCPECKYKKDLIKILKLLLIDEEL